MDKKTGYIGIFITLLITGLLWFLSKSVGGIVNFPYLSVGQITALFGTILLSWSMFLATRLDFLEHWFGGMDRVYIAHKKTSIFGMALIIAHVLALALEKLPNMAHVVNYFFPIHNQTYINLGAYGFWLFVIFISLTLLMKTLKIPYHLWKAIHKLTGVALFLSFVHILVIPGGMSGFLPLNLWVLGTTGIGIASWLYFEFFYKILAPNYKYKVTEINKYKDTYEISLLPLKERMVYKVGQFAYLSFIESAVSKETHPFSMSSHPDEKKISFAVKVLGDYTGTLNKLKVGDIAKIWGPYGTFADEFLKTAKDSVFIGGGIGIAPFINMTKEALKSGKTTRKVSLYYCTKFKCDACFDRMLEKPTKEKPNYYYVNKCSREEGRLHASKVVEKMKDVENTLVFICGPSRMVRPLTKDFKKEGVLKQNIITENFDLI